MDNGDGQKKEFTILVIDDSPQDHELYREFLADDSLCAFHFIHAYNGSDGERLYRENKVDCVIIDYRLPDIDGIEVLRRLSHEQEAVPAIMLTGQGNERVAVVAMQSGLQDYIPKGVITPQALRRTVERAAERTHLIRRMETYRADLTRSNEDLERFVSVVAHDLKSPLRAISQHLQLVEESNAGKLDERSLKSIAFAVDGAERLRKLIDALFEYSRVGFESHRQARVDFNQVLEGVLSNLASNIEETGAIITADPLPTLTADSTQIMQLLQNLLSNSLKFCKDQPRVHVGAQLENNAWIFSVRDNGIGMPKGAEEKIFTIFRRLHSEKEYPGSGIGLAISARVVQNHGGRLWVQSEPDKGTIFYFSLPFVAAAQQDRAA